MKRIVLIFLVLLTKLSFGQSNTDWNGSVTFPADFKVGDYIEFIRVSPLNAGASGNYEIAISYTRGNVAAGATFLASISHANPDVWREVGRINSNGYGGDPNGHSFTVDCNTAYGYSRFRIRAIRVLGVNTPITVDIKIRSISQNNGWEPLNNSGSDLSINKFLPMTTDWSLYVGNTFTTDGATLAIKAIQNGNVGIGTDVPKEKLSVNGNIRAKEVKVETANWPDYVFRADYEMTPLPELEKYIKANNHLPEMPSAKEVESNGVSLGEMNKKLLQKVEELTLHLIEKDKELQNSNLRLEKLETEHKNDNLLIDGLSKRLEQIEQNVQHK